MAPTTVQAVVFMGGSPARAGGNHASERLTRFIPALAPPD